MTNILLIEDHQIIRDGLKSLLKDVADICIIGEGSNGKDVIEILSGAQTNPDLIIMDLNMPVMNGFETIKYLQENYSEINVLILSMYDQENYVADMFKAGAKGYMLKNTGKDELIYAIKRISAGGLYISPEIVVKMLLKVSEDKVNFNEKDLTVPLSKREIEVLSLLAEGLTNNEIAEKLFTSRRTVETHRKHLIEKTGSKNTASLIKFAIYNKILK